MFLPKAVAAGTTTQVHILLDSPVAISDANLSLDFELTVFGEIASVDVFSATGDQTGAAVTTGTHADITFSSLTGGIGRLPGVPIVAITIPVLATAATGSKGNITARVTSGAWKDVAGNVLQVSPLSASVSINGRLAVSAVSPGGGMLPAGTVARITGSGFTPSTQVQVDSVAVGAMQYVSANEIDVTLAGAADLTAKRVVVGNEGEPPVEFFSELHGPYVKRPAKLPLSAVQPIFPNRTNAGAVVGNGSTDTFALLNQNLEPVLFQGFCR
jgi:hypothetical protein